MAPLFLLSVMVASGLSVEGTSRCPAPEEVQPLLTEQSPTPQRLRLQREPQSLRVTLMDASGGLLAERSLPVDATCAELALATAAVVSAWQLELLHTLDLDGPSTSRPVSALEQTPPTAAVPLGTRAAPFVPPMAPPLPEPLRLTVGASVAAVGAGSSTRSPGFGAFLLVGASGGLFGVVELSAFGARSLSLGPGEVRWRRANAAVGAGLGHRWGGLEAGLELRAVTGRLEVRGEGFTRNEGRWWWDTGGSLKGRLAFGRGRWRPFLTADGTAWFAHRTAAVQGVAETRPLPRHDASVGMGLLGTLR